MGAFVPSDGPARSWESAATSVLLQSVHFGFGQRFREIAAGGEASRAAAPGLAMARLAGPDVERETCFVGREGSLQKLGIVRGLPNPLDG